MNSTLESANSVNRGIDALTNGIDTLIEQTKTRQRFKLCIKDQKVLGALVGTINSFVHVDTHFTSGAQKVGIVLQNILDKQGYDEQITFIRAMCQRQGITPIKDRNGNDAAGKAGLKHALFGAYPELSRRSGKDTLAGKRFSYYLSLAKRGAVVTPRDANKVASAPTAISSRITDAGELFKRLYAAADHKGQELLCGLASRAGIVYKQWLPVDTVVVRSRQPVLVSPVTRGNGAEGAMSHKAETAAF